VLGPIVVFGLALFVAGEDAATREAGIIVVAILGALLAAWEWLVTRTRLVLTAQGLELHQLGMRLDAAWADVETLELRRGREGFVVRTPLEGAGAARLATLSSLGALGTPLYDDRQRALVGERRFVPIEAFARHAHRGTLLNEVTRLAPHVRIYEPPPASAPRPRRTLLAALIIAIAVGVGLAVATAEAADRAVLALQAVALPLVVLSSAVKAWRALRSRAFLLGVLLMALTLAMLGWTIAVWQDFSALLDS
jgi:hypothetical protein